MASDFLQKIRILHGNIHETAIDIRKKLYYQARKCRNIFERNKISFNKFTIISNTCIGGVIYHDLGIRFQSPTINVYIRPKDFVKFCENISFYLTLPLIEVPYNAQIGYPVGQLGDITLYCKHYATFEEAKQMWDSRKNRIDWDHIYFIMTDRDFIPPVSATKSICSCGEAVLQRFNQLPFENKVCIVKDEKYAQKYECCYQLLKGCDKDCVGIITNIIGITGKRMYQYVQGFDYINFINNEM